MDWYIIEKHYPKAFKEFTNTMFPNIGLPCLSLLSYYEIKKLYNFFDKNGIYLTVEMITKNNWVYTISLIDGKFIIPYQNIKENRELIEIEGFNECFKLLENKMIGR